MATIAPVRRLSPRVRRLLAEHAVDGRRVPGTGAGGRLRPRDVLTAAGVPRPPAAGTVLASPRARRVLQDAGLDLADAAASIDGRRLTRREAEALVAQRSTGRRAAAVERRASPARAPGHASVVAAAADVAELLALIEGTQSAFVARHGHRLGIEAPIAVAATAVLARDARRPGRGGTNATTGSGTSRPATEVVVGFHTPASGGANLRIVRHTQDLTVAGLARRSRAAAPVPLGGRESAIPTVVLTTAPTAPVDALVDAADLGLLEIGEIVLREVRRTDHLGHEVVRLRPHCTLRWHHDTHVDDDRARALLRGVCDELAAWTLPVER